MGVVPADFEKRGKLNSLVNRLGGGNIAGCSTQLATGEPLMAHSCQCRNIDDAAYSNDLLGVYDAASKQQPPPPQQHHKHHQTANKNNPARSPSHLPATVFLSDGERDASTPPSRLVCEEDRERWVRAPPNCNPFDAHASFSCSSISCRTAREASVQAIYSGRSRLNTATGVERPSCGRTGIQLGSGLASSQSMKMTPNSCTNNSITKRICHSTDCRQHVDGCFSSRTRWSPSLDTSQERRSLTHPVVYVPVRLDNCNANKQHSSISPLNAVLIKSSECESTIHSEQSLAPNHFTVPTTIYSCPHPASSSPSLVRISATQTLPEWNTTALPIVLTRTCKTPTTAIASTNASFAASTVNKCISQQCSASSFSICCMASSLRTIANDDTNSGQTIT
ncbi:unnamed protein product [Anisakis simplex]|uniref:Uncharacterized protein n=1 Tax=Anisakis simplex TaxID=6269 RepID=A0A0M3JU74_ANISI|nr:unnamed protein product [Anisakis simplex]